ncbi:hypothetical protein C489_20826 [Natrinema versiforme JCM 10478]|uniref:Uncharacterized protein n=1 Tax=Natrinema versiforme JCM 10478 TaxID=1227496 RepID=L9XMQ4_9EURY|nr:hypothetical protein C489_20826 [Natrinema versiforme JCM 10478]
MPASSRHLFQCVPSVPQRIRIASLRLLLASTLQECDRSKRGILLDVRSLLGFRLLRRARDGLDQFVSVITVRKFQI